MAFNLLEVVQEGLPPSFADMAGGLLGESGSATGAALTAIIPTLIAAIARKGASDSGAHSVMAMLTNSAVDPAKLSSLGSIFGSGGAQANSMISAGTSIASSVFGDKLAPLASELGALSGLAKPQSATNIVGLAATVVLAFVKRFAASANLSAAGLSALLGSQGQFLQGALNARLTSALGFTDPAAMLASLGSRAMAALPIAGENHAGASGAAVDGAASEGASLFGRWWPWLIGAVVVLFLLSRFMISQRVEVAPVQPPAPMAAPTASAPAVTSAIPRMLPAKIYFDVGSTTLGAGSKPVIDAVAALVKQAGGTMDITGFADATGDAQVNAALAKNRAKAVYDALAATGIPEATLKLTPPASFTGGGDDAEARRVEVAKAK